jgi:hypothetical protein
MPDFCSEIKETILNSNYMDNYQTASRKSCLPNNGAGFPSSSVSNKGMVNKADLDTQLNTLLREAKAVAPNTVQSDNLEPAAAFADKAAALRKDIQTEYCFYYKRYIYILHDILMSAATMGTGSLPSVYVTKKQNTEKLNAKLNQILQLLQALVNSRLTTLKGYYGPDSGVNSLNKDLDTTRERLVKHSEMLKKNDLEKDAKAAMIDYSIEKNSSSRNLLAIYGFMNIVAAGLIFYLYRTAKSE